MKVLDFILGVVGSDLRQIAIADVGTGSTSDSATQASNMTVLTDFVNQGLVELHKRFPLKVDVYEADVETYSTATEGLVEQSYVKLPNEAFSLVRVTTDEYVDVPLDDKDTEALHNQGTYKKLFIRTVAVNTYVVGGYNEDNVRDVYFSYTAAPSTVGLTQELPLPAAYLEALRHYVGYRGYSSVKSVTPVGDEGISYLKKFEASCELLKNTTGMLYDHNDFDVDKLYRKGFV